MFRRAFATAVKNAKAKEKTAVGRASPKTLRVGSEAAARRLIAELKPRLRPGTDLLEINPGPGFLTRELLELNPPALRLFEASPDREPSLEALADRFPDRIEYRNEDFFRAWRSSFADGGERSLSRLRTFRSSDAPRDATVVGCLPDSSFFRHLVASGIFRSSPIALERLEFFLVTFPSDRKHLDCDEANPKSHRYLTVLFNVLFEHDPIAKLPREDYSPSKMRQDGAKGPNEASRSESEKKYLHLVRLRAKRPPCDVENLPLLWYFCKHYLRNRENRIVPKLEEWIPNCGIWLITGQDPPGTSTLTAPDERDEPLPHITIFTQFQDLSPGQKLTLFKKFISWPEFENSAFREALDGYMSGRMQRFDDKIDAIEADDENPDEP